ncbi:MAG: Uma2 family endonuclease [Methylococcaceae bacterium]|nr:Uma2 family endonuclease [Methylococcaceae bacterium]
MAWQASFPLITEQEYLAGELVSEIKHEYIGGVAYAMAGASANHGRIVANLVAKLHPHLANTPCELFSSDMKVKAGKGFFYPDVIVDCHNESGDVYYTESPIIIVEVLSKSTRKTDKALKRLSYQAIPSLQEYVLIEQDFVEVEICRRASHWQSEYYFLGDETYFASIDLTVPVEEIYARVANEDMAEFLKLKAQAENL